jgi:hypothetical protein
LLKRQKEGSQTIQRIISTLILELKWATLAANCGLSSHFTLSYRSLLNVFSRL